jgi:hypothetical protein
MNPGERKLMNEQITANEGANPDDPQTRVAIKAWMKKYASPGIVVVIRCGIAHLKDEYLLDEISELKPKNGRIWTRTPLSYKAATIGRYYYTGQSCDDPMGQVEMLIPTPNVVGAAIQGNSRINNRVVHETLIDKAREQTSRLFGETL